MGGLAAAGGFCETANQTSCESPDDSPAINRAVDPTLLSQRQCVRTLALQGRPPRAELDSLRCYSYD